MKHQQTLKYCGLAAAALVLALSSNISQADDDIIVGPTATQADISGSSPDYIWQNMWGPAFVSLTFDAANPPPTGDTEGSIYIQGNWPGPNADNYCVGAPSTWWGGATFDAAQYESVELDIKYDTNSTMTPLTAPNVSIGFDQGYSLTSLTNVSFGTGSALADGTWHHLVIAVPSNINATSSHSVGFYQWNPDNTTGTMNFWVANVVIKARLVASPPPTVALKKTVPGLTQFADKTPSYDRQDIRTDQSGTAAVTWYGQTKPVTYSWEIAAYPSATYPNFQCGLTLTPDAAAAQTYADPDWSANDCLWVVMQNNADGTVTAGIAWKTNQPSANSQLFGSGVLVPYNNTTNGLTVPSAVGTWSVTFTSDTALTLTAPNGASTNVVIDASFAALFNGYVGAFLYSTPAQDANIGQSVTLSQFKITGVGTPVNEDLTSGALSSPFLTLMSQGYGTSTNPPNEVFVTANDVYWYSWTLPASGFSPVSAASLDSSAVWNDIAGTSFQNSGTYMMKISKAQLPSSSTGFFGMIKRQASQLQVLMPGETNAPNTVTGKVGTPTATNAYTEVDATVYVVDSTFHIVNGSDTVQMSSSDSSATFLNLDSNGMIPLVNGAATVQIYFGTTGDQTVTAADTTNTNITSATSSPITIQ